MLRVGGVQQFQAILQIFGAFPENAQFPLDKPRTFLGGEAVEIQSSTGSRLVSQRQLRDPQGRSHFRGSSLEIAHLRPQVVQGDVYPFGSLLQLGILTGQPGGHPAQIGGPQDEMR